MLLPTPLAQDEALRVLSDIRLAIDRAARYSTFSALAGGIAAGAALAGSGLCGIFGEWAGARPEAGLAFLTVWGAVFTVALLALLTLTRFKARRRGEEAWTPIARTACQVLLGPALAGLLGTLALFRSGDCGLLPGLWLSLYGCGLYAVSFFAPLFIRSLGIGFLLLGFGAWLLPELAALWLGLGFGVLHLVFTAVVMARYRR